MQSRGAMRCDLHHTMIYVPAYMTLVATCRKSLTSAVCFRKMENVPAVKYGARTFYCPCVRIIYSYRSHAVWWCLLRSCCVHACVYVCCECVRARVHTHARAYIHTHTHTLTYSPIFYILYKQKHTRTHTRTRTAGTRTRHVICTHTYL